MDVVGKILGKKTVYWVEDVDDPSVEFEGSVSESLVTAEGFKKVLEKQMPGKRFVVRRD